MRSLRLVALLAIPAQVAFGQTPAAPRAVQFVHRRRDYNRAAE